MPNSNDGLPMKSLWFVLGAAGLLTFACSKEVGRGTGGGPMGTGASGGAVVGGMGGSVGVGGSDGVAATGVGGGVGTTTTTGAVAAGGTSSVPTDCTLAESNVTESKRLVRLTWNQQVNSLSSLLDQTIADQVVSNFAIQGPEARTFPPLLNPREGRTITDAVWQQGDNIAQAAAKYVFDNFATITQCTDAPTTDCAQGFVETFGERAYRRPLTANELTRLDGVYNGVITGGGTIQEGVQYGVYAVLSSPAYLYRSEYGDNALAEGPLTSYEMASLVSYFVTDGPPDQPLLDAAASGALATSSGVDSEVARLLATPEAQANLESAMLALFNIPRVLSVVVDPGVGEVTAAHKASMLTEAEMFLHTQLWNGENVSQMLLTRNTMVNTTMADIYGIAAPAGATTDTFQPAELGPERAGILTMPGFLTGVTRPTGESVVGRGLAVNAALLCADNPAFPENLADAVAAVSSMLEGATEKEKAAYRASDPSCQSCHGSFDPYGLVLENYDLMGRYRTVDEEGRPIDTAVTAPEAVGGFMVADAPDMAQQLVDSGRFASCLVKSMVSAALAEGAPSVTACAIKNIADTLANTDGSFPALVRQVAVSSTLGQRMAGTQQ